MHIPHNGAGALDKGGTLYILAIGVDTHPTLGKACRERDGSPKTCDLHVAGADARVFADTMEARRSGRHERVIKRGLVNGSVPQMRQPKTTLLMRWARCSTPSPTTPS